MGGLLQTTYLKVDKALRRGLEEHLNTLVTVRSAHIYVVALQPGFIMQSVFSQQCQFLSGLHQTVCDHTRLSRSCHHVAAYVQGARNGCSHAAPSM